MKRLRIGIAILLLFALLGGGFWWGSKAFFGSFSQEMEEAATAAVEKNWNFAIEKVEECRQKWEKSRHFWAAFTDHAPIEQMQVLFSQLQLYEKQNLSAEFAACCRALAREAEAIEESHSLAWWSLL